MKKKKRWPDSPEKQFVQDVGDYICKNVPYLVEDNVAGGCTEWRNWKFEGPATYTEIDVFDMKITFWSDKEHQIEWVYKSLNDFKKEF